jgi:hypothetical protein
MIWEQSRDGVYSIIKHVGAQDTTVSTFASQITVVRQNPNLNVFAERWVGSVKEECLSRLIFFGFLSRIRCRSGDPRRG